MSDSLYWIVYLEEVKIRGEFIRMWVMELDVLGVF